MTTFLGIQVEIFAGILIPAASAAGVAIWQIIKFFHNKEICFTLLKQKVEAQEQETEDGHETHKDLYSKVDSLTKNIHLIMGHLGIEPVK